MYGILLREVCTLEFAFSCPCCFLESPPLLTSSYCVVASPPVLRPPFASVTTDFLRQWPIAVADLILALGWNMVGATRERRAGSNNREWQESLRGRARNSSARSNFSSRALRIFGWCWLKSSCQVLSKLYASVRYNAMWFCVALRSAQICNAPDLQD